MMSLAEVFGSDGHVGQGPPNLGPESESLTHWHEVLPAITHELNSETCARYIGYNTLVEQTECLVENPQIRGQAAASPRGRCAAWVRLPRSAARIARLRPPGRG
jgi:hypothetical protein